MDGSRQSVEDNGTGTRTEHVSDENAFYKEEEDFWRAHAARLEGLGAKEFPCTTQPSVSGTSVEKDECRQKGRQVGQSAGLDQSSMLLDALLLPGTGCHLQETSQRHLDLHRNIIELASVRSHLLAEGRKLREQKSALCDQKLTQQARLISKLNGRLHAAVSALDQQSFSLDQKVRLIEEYSGKCARILQGLVAEPSQEDWSSIDAQYSRLLRFRSECLAELNCLGFDENFNFSAVDSRASGENKRLNDRITDLEAKLENAHVDKETLANDLACKTKKLDEVQEECEMLKDKVEKDKEVVTSEKMSEVRRQYQQAIKQIEGRHSEEVQRLEELLAAKTAMESITLEPSAAERERDFYLDPCMHLRSAVAECSEKSLDVVPSATRLRESYQKMLLEMQNRYQKEKEKLQWEHKREVTALREAHDESIGRLTNQLRIRGFCANETNALEAEVKILGEDNKRLKDELKHVTEEFESKKEYALYTLRCEHEKEMMKLRDQYHETMDSAKQEVLDLHSSVASYKKSGALSPTKVKHVVEDALRVREAEYRAQLIKSDESWKNNLEKVKMEYEAALNEREQEYDAMLAELHLLRETHAVSSESPASEISRKSSSIKHLVNVKDKMPSPVRKSCSSSCSKRDRKVDPRVGDQERPVSRSETECDGKSESCMSGQSESRSSLSAMVEAVLEGGGGKRHEEEVERKLTKAKPTARRSSGKTKRCIRCGLNDSMSPGLCRFHPALLRMPGPLLYSPEWHACKAAGHSVHHKGCYTRREHYYPIDSRDIHETLALSSPKPRASQPVPSSLKEIKAEITSRKGDL